MTAIIRLALILLMVIGALGSTSTIAQAPPNPGDTAAAQPEAGVSDTEAQLVTAGKRELRVHDPSTLIKQGDRYWLFSTGPGIRAFYSDNLIQWHRAGSVFERDKYPGWITDVAASQKGHFWAPDVIHHNGRYLVYYSVSAMGKRTSAIALTSAPTLDTQADNFGWTDHGIVIQTTEDNDFNAIDPAVLFDQDGRMWMVFGSFWSGIKLIELDPKTGKRIADDSPMHALAWSHSIEAPAIYYHDGFYYLFVNWGRCCAALESTYNIRVGRSRTITGPYIDKRGKPMTEGGGSPFLGTAEPNFIGPGHVGVLVEDDGTERLSVHFYDGTLEGKPMLALRDLQWDADGWPKTPGPGDAADYEGWQRQNQ